MQHYRQPIRKCALAILLLVFLLLPLVCAAQDTSASLPATNDSPAGRMLVLIEQRNQIEQLIASGEGRIEELNKQLVWKDEEILHLQEIIKLKDEKIQLYIEKDAVRQDTEKMYQNKEKTMQTLYDAKDKAYEERIKAATPTFMDNMTKYVTGVGIGGILAGIVLLLL